MTRKTLATIMPNYNDRSHLNRAVSAVLEQSRPPDELILIDDGSTDGSIEVLEELAARHPRAKVLRNQRNLGVCHSFNRAILTAESDYVNFVSMDDFINPVWFEEAMGLIEREGGLPYVAADIAIYEPDRQLASITPYGLTDRPARITPEELSGKLAGWALGGTTMVVDRLEHIRIGMYPAHLGHRSDFFICQALAMRHGVGYIPEPMATARQRATSHSSIASADSHAATSIDRLTLEELCSEKYRDIRDRFCDGGYLKYFSTSALLDRVLRYPGRESLRLLSAKATQAVPWSVQRRLEHRITAARRYWRLPEPLEQHFDPRVVPCELVKP